MLRMVVSSNAEGATKYFTDALSVGDYYAENQTCKGTWHGKGAWQLGLTREGRSGLVEQEQFRAMALNKHPTERGPLTERTVGNRRVGYDINFHAPKSVSVLHALTQDERVLAAFRSAVTETMQQMEAEMKCRVRVGGAQEDRAVGNLCWAEFVHFTARPVGGRPDPHLHAHCFTFNAAYDGAEQKWKAGQFGDLKRDAPFFESCFHARLASGLVDLGYEVERRGKGWEIATVPQSVVETFSRRTAEIEAKATELGISDAERKSGLGAKTRARKNDSRPLRELRGEWSELVDPEVRASILNAPTPGEGRFGRGVERTSAAAVELATSTTFERQSVVSERQFLTATMKNALGSVPLAELEGNVKSDGKFIRQELDGVSMVTTKEVMAEEERMIAFARCGRGACAPLAPGHTIKDERLNDQQRAAVLDVLNSTDRVVLVRGGAGTGKTTLIREAVAGILGPPSSPSDPATKTETLREPITFLAPSADASRGVLRSEGFKSADTVAKFLGSQVMQESARGGVLWVDEAGLLGSRTMAALCEVASQLDVRVVLSGDPGQHRAVERGDPLGLFTKYGGVEAIGVDKVQRQRGLYKSAVEHLAKGEAELGFEGLRKLGCIREMDGAKAHKEIAWNYATQVERGRSALIVSPTHAEGARVTECVREELKRRGLLKVDDVRRFDRLEDLRLTEGEKSRADRYEKGQVVQFHQNTAGFAAGKRYTVAENVPGEGVKLDGGRVLPLGKASLFNVYKHHEKAVELCVGDTIRVTSNGKSLVDEKRSPERPHALNNGATYRVAGFTEEGNVKLDNGWTLDRDFGHLTHGYCSTSHSSQGKTVDLVLVAESANSFGAASAEQFYVSVSRGKWECVVYTDDVEGLKERVGKGSLRRSAVELSDGVQESEHLEREAVNAARQFEESAARQWQELAGPTVDREAEMERGFERGW